VTVYDDAIESSAWVGVAGVTIGGGSNPLLNNLVCDVSIDRAVDDLTEQVTNIAGTAAAQATITLKGGNASGTALQLSPFSTNSNSMRNVARYGIGQTVQVTEWVYPAATLSGTPSGYSLFTGTIDTISLGEDSVTITALDTAGTLQGTVNLPAAAGTISSFTSVQTTLNPLGVVDLSLRSAGKCLTPTLRSNAILSVPGIGACLPEVGAFLTGPSTYTNLASPWPAYLPTVDVASSTSFQDCASFTCTGPMMTVPGASISYVHTEGWFYLSRPGSRLGFLVQGDESAGEVQWCIETGGQVSARHGPAGSPFFTTTGTIPVGPGWVHLYLILSDNGWAYVSINGATVESALSAGYDWASFKGLLQVRLNARALGLQVWNLSSSSTAGTNVSWLPNYSASLDSMSTRVYAMARQSAPAWQTVQQVAKAYGDVTWWDGAGAFHYETRPTWKARRATAASRTFTEARIFSGMPSWDAQSVCRSVSANVVTPQVAQSATAAPAWSATETYTVAARSTVTVHIDLDYQVYDVKPVLRGFQASAANSWAQAVAAASVGDPAATLLGAFSVSFMPTATGLDMTVVNNNSVSIALWSPGDGGSIAAGPYLVVHGKTIRFPEPKVLTRAAAAAGQDLTMDDNQWRQDTSATAAWLDDIAQEVAYPQVLWPALNIPMDPRRSVGDVVAIQDARHMDVAHPVQIVGTNFDLPAEGDMHKTSLTIRSAYAPTGLIVGVMSLPVGTSLLVKV
jgi:hypothetical protein